MANVYNCLLAMAQVPQPGEETIYARASALLAVAQKDPAIKTMIIDRPSQAGANLNTSLFTVNTFGVFFLRNGDAAIDQNCFSMPK